MILAAYNGHKDIVEYLVSRGADKDVKNNDNNTQNGNNNTPSVEEAFRGLDISNVQVIM